MEESARKWKKVLENAKKCKKMQENVTVGRHRDGHRDDCGATVGRLCDDCVTVDLPRIYPKPTPKSSTEWRESFKKKLG